MFAYIYVYVIRHMDSPINMVIVSNTLRLSQRFEVVLLCNTKQRKKII